MYEITRIHFLLSKSQTYHFDHIAIQEPSVNPDGMKEHYEYEFWGSGKHQSGGYGGRHTSGIKIPQTKGRDRTVGNRNGLGKSTLDHKNLQYDGQQPHSFHESRANGEPDETYYVRNKRDVWHITTKSFKDAHFATFPEELVVPMVLAGCPKDGLIYDPFFGAGTVGVVAHKLERNWIGSELNPDYVEIANRRLEPYLLQSKLF